MPPFERRRPAPGPPAPAIFELRPAAVSASRIPSARHEATLHENPLTTLDHHINRTFHRSRRHAPQLAPVRPAESSPSDDEHRCRMNNGGDLRFAFRLESGVIPGFKAMARTQAVRWLGSRRFHDGGTPPPLGRALTSLFRRSLAILLELQDPLTRSEIAPVALRVLPGNPHAQDCAGVLPWNLDAVRENEPSLSGIPEP